MANKTLFILCYHLWTINILSISFILVVLKKNNILLKMPLTKLLTKLKKNVKAWLKDFHKDNPNCGVSTILGYKWSKHRREISHSFECVEDNILCPLQGGW